MPVGSKVLRGKGEPTLTGLQLAYKVCLCGAVYMAGVNVWAATCKTDEDSAKDRLGGQNSSLSHSQLKTPSLKAKQVLTTFKISFEMARARGWGFRRQKEPALSLKNLAVEFFRKT